MEERGWRFYAERQEEPDSDAEVFFNPEMRSNRDVSVAAAKTYFDEKPVVLDATAASGIRGMRYSDTADRLLLNDVSEAATEAMNKGLDANDLDAEVTRRDARALMAERKFEFDLVDVDPYGSFLSYLDPAATAVVHGGLVGLTATDLAGPAGSYSKVCRRRYGSRPLKTEFMHETGLRIYMKEVYRSFARHNRSFQPLICFYNGHYSRLMGSVNDSKQGANRNLDNIGYLSFCHECRFRVLERREMCENCGAETEVAGPLWTGRIADSRFASNLSENIPERWEEAIEIVEHLESEADIKTPFYDLHELASAAGTPCPPVQRFVEGLREKGYPTTRTHFSPTGVRTTAPINQLHELCEEVSS